MLVEFDSIIQVLCLWSTEGTDQNMVITDHYAEIIQKLIESDLVYFVSMLIIIACVTDRLFGCSGNINGAVPLQTTFYHGLNFFPDTPARVNFPIVQLIDCQLPGVLKEAVLSELSRYRQNACSRRFICTMTCIVFRPSESNWF